MGFTVTDYEKIILGSVFRHPSELGSRVAVMVEPESFDYSLPHRTIFQGVKKSIEAGDVPDVATVARHLNSKLSEVGDIQYLHSLTDYLDIAGVVSTENVAAWANVLNTAGRLRQLRDLTAEQGKMFDDFDNLVMQTNNLDEFVHNYMVSLTSVISGLDTDYQHISTAVSNLRLTIEQAKQGVNHNLIMSGIPSLQRYMIPRVSTFGVIDGMTSSGKTTWALWLAMSTADNLYQNGIEGVVSINSLETNAERLAMRMACMKAMVNSLELSQGTLTAEQEARLEKAMAHIQALPIYYNDNPDITSEAYVTQAMALNLKHNRVLGIGDYIELFGDAGEKSEELRISKITRTIRKVAWVTASCEAFISQVNDSVMRTGDKIAGLHSTRQSRSVAHAADWLIEIVNYPQMRQQKIKAKPPETMSKDKAYALILKNKDYPLGQIPMMWRPSYTRFEDEVLGGKLYQIEKAVKEDF